MSKITIEINDQHLEEIRNLMAQILDRLEIIVERYEEDE
tara:strand:+ start:51 stop:167 length:117 start_codon:yes stop_codon:yes gene_type:complete